MESAVIKGKGCTRSRDHLRQLLGGRDVDIQRDGKDRYRRAVVVIWQGGL